MIYGSSSKTNDQETATITHAHPSKHAHQKVTLAVLIAYCANLALVALSWRAPRVRFYALGILVLDLLCLLVLLIPSDSLAVFALDGILVMASPLLLALALKVDPWPMAGLGGLAVLLALREVQEGRREATEGVYVAAHLVAHLYLVAASSASKEWRKSSDVFSWVLVGLAATGATGAVIAITWGAWDLVNTGNVVAHVLLGLLTFLVSRRDQVG